MLSKVGEIYEGKITGLTSFGAFVKLSNGETGMVHISEVAYAYVKDISSYLSEGQEVRVKVINIGENNKISLSIKQAEDKPKDPARPPRPSAPRRSEAPRESVRPQSPSSAGPMSFEDMMAKFKADSEEKMSDLRRASDGGRSSRRGNKS